MVKPPVVAPLPFDLRQGRIRVPDQRSSFGRILGKQGDSNFACDMQLIVQNGERLFEGSTDQLADQLRRFSRLTTAQQNRKFVASESRDCIFRVRNLHESSCNLPQKDVSSSMAIGVIYASEAIQVERKYRKR